MHRAATAAVARPVVTVLTLRAQQPTFRATVDLVNFGVAVVDKQGKPVAG